MGKVKKWGFGSAPIKNETEIKYIQSLKIVMEYVEDTSKPISMQLLDGISQVKGLFNRIIKQDQWDWFTVNMYLDYPDRRECIKLVSLLTELRVAVKELNLPRVESIAREIIQTNFKDYANSFISFDMKNDMGNYIYILSRREEKEVLKIGMTTRNVIMRCQEINSATGVVFPFSPRKAYRVLDASKAEKLIHMRLAKYRIRDDREFFLISFKEACEEIEKCLIENQMLYYKY